MMQTIVENAVKFIEAKRAGRREGDCLLAALRHPAHNINAVRADQCYHIRPGALGCHQCPFKARVKHVYIDPPYTAGERGE